MDNVSDFVRQHSQSDPERLALILPKETVTYRQLEDDINALAKGLRACGIEEGTTVALLVPPSRELFALVFALFRIAAVPTILDPGLGIRAIAKIFSRETPHAFIGSGLGTFVRWLGRWPIGKGPIITTGPKLFGARLTYADLRQYPTTPLASSGTADSMAAILYTSGSTGPAKGAVYKHRHFLNQIELLRTLLPLEPGAVNVPTFPLFALFDPGLGLTTALPAMDFTKPAKVDPERLSRLVQSRQAKFLFGSPALLDRVFGWAVDDTKRRERFSSLRAIFSAGAPVNPRILANIRRCVPNNCEIFTPYGATESLPIAIIESHEVLAQTAALRAAGKGTCVGRVAPRTRVQIASVTFVPMDESQWRAPLDTTGIGDIWVSGPQVTEAYWRRDSATAFHKWTDSEGTLWHRTGDLGYFDDEQRLWFCGRATDRIVFEGLCYDTDRIEGIFDTLNGVARCALVRTRDGKPAIVVEPRGTLSADWTVRARRLADDHGLRIDRFACIKQLPVDIRHNAKIKRQELGLWLDRQR